MKTASLVVLTCFFAIIAQVASAHQGPDPIVHWAFNNRTIADGVCEARLGPDLQLSPSVAIATDKCGQSLDLTSDKGVPATTQVIRNRNLLPENAFTLSAWVLIDEAESNGIIAGAFGQDGEAAWVLGYDENVFITKARVAGQAPIVLRGSSDYEKGQWTHVTVVFDGQQVQIYVNGKIDGVVEEVDGKIDYPMGLRYAVAGHADDVVRPLRGRIRTISLYDLAAKPRWIEEEFKHNQRLVKMTTAAREDALAMVVSPYLQYGTKDSMTIMWQTTLPGTSVVHYGETNACDKSTSRATSREIHEVRIEDLEPETQYFYRVETQDKSGRTVSSRVSTFSTAVKKETPFAFVVISDTQMNPVVAAKLSKLAWAQRPNFLLHPGDLVDTGVNDSHWTQHFFPGMSELISRVPMYPVLGNHEQNASNYYDYMALPDPEYYYDFQYGNAHFFMIDSNRNVGPGSEQYEWLEKQLSESKATWKFVCHHHPPYSSDENDYGDLWKTNKSSRGDLRVRQLSALYDKHGVDIVWNGHIHSYERTWPVREGKAVPENGGPIYMITGGGGGSLETPGPYRPFFQNQVRRGHHYVMVHINGERLELRSYDLEDQLFDTTMLKK